MNLLETKTFNKIADNFSSNGFSMPLPLEPLTEGEMQVLKQLYRSSEEIAESIQKSKRLVESRVSELIYKFSAKNRAEVIVKALSSGTIDLSDLIG